jgi:AcrR family transcriptional regulator
MLPKDDSVDPRIRRTRRLLEDSFLALVDEKGFQAINVQDITGRAGINRATFYAHFPDKYALLDYVVQQQFREELEKRTLNVCTLSQENLRALVLAVCEFVGHKHEHSLPPHGQYESLVENQVRGQIYGLIHHWLEKETLAIRPETVATAASWVIYGLAHEWAHQKARSSAEAYASQVLPLVAANLPLAHAV